MSSYQLSRSHSNQQVHNCFASSSYSFCSETERGCSKAPNCLVKILRIISNVPPDNTPANPPSLSSEKLNGCNGFAIDLNIGFNVAPEKEESGSPVDGAFISGLSTSSAACENLVEEKSPVAAECGGVLTVDVGKCSDDDGECGKGEAKKSCKSDSSVVQLQSTKNQEIIKKFQLENNGVSETSKSKEQVGELKEQQGFMGLLIEAATLIFGDFKDKNPKSECETKSFKSECTREKLKMSEHLGDVAAKKQLKRRNNECTEEAVADKSSYPLVRSKRGRIQVLPNKYRDSIMEPLTPFSRIRSTIVSNRRRSK